MVRRIYVEKIEGFNTEALRLKGELADFLGSRCPELEKLKDLRIFRRYDISGLDEEQFKKTVSSVFSEPQCDRVFPEHPLDVSSDNPAPADSKSRCFGIEYLPGQYDQRADSAEQCAELVTGVKPVIKTAVFYAFIGGGKPLSQTTLEEVKKYLINPVDSREASPDLPDTLDEEEKTPPDVPVLRNFISEDSEFVPEKWLKKFSLAMSAEDLAFCRAYFIREGRNPTLTELRLLDTYWSDHCRHTTFNTILNEIEPLKPGTGKKTGPEKALALYRKIRREVYGKKAASRPETLMDMATIGARYLKKKGLADDVDTSAEVNACTLKIEAEFAASKKTKTPEKEPWLLLFKNETHNHPTEIEPFGGSATCLGGAIRDPLSGRAYVHQAMRISGGGNPQTSAADTLPGKLPQVKLARGASHGYSSYGNQIGIATGQVTELYHPGFLAKRLELGAVIGAVPEAWVRREEPLAGDIVILVGGRTGRDGIGGATGSSKVHSGESVAVSGAEVQKGNAVEERKLQRLFRNQNVCRLIKRCNDFGAGGVSVAVGELADGLDIDLDRVPKKYAGLDGTELAISESQERMAVVVAKEDAQTFISLASAENLEATIIAGVTASAGEKNARLRMSWRGKNVADLSREFLNTSGAPRNAAVSLPEQAENEETVSSVANLPPGALLDNLERELASLRSGSRRGLQERFDGSIGAGSVLFPWGGSEQGTPECGMAALLPSLEKKSLTASLMTFGYDPAVMERNPYQGAKGSVLEALAKFACLGGDYTTARLSFQEYFERPQSRESWGMPAAALLGALEAQIHLEIPAIGGKDSMSGNFRTADMNLSVPPTLVAFAAGIVPAVNVRSGVLSGKAGNTIVLLLQNPSKSAKKDEWGRFKENMKILWELTEKKLVRSAYPVGSGGIAASLAVMAFGNMTGLEVDERVFSLTNEYNYQGSVLAEVEGPLPDNRLIMAAKTLGTKSAGEPVFRIVRDSPFNDNDESSAAAEIPLAILRRAYEYPLSQVYPETSDGFTVAEPSNAAVEISRPPFTRKPLNKTASKSRPLAVLPVFPGTNCEWDMERSFREAGAKTKLVVFRNRSREDIRDSLAELEAAIKTAQIVALSGGFSAGDEPDGSGKFIANVLRSPLISAALTQFLEERDGLVLGICNGFQALIKTGLLPYGAFRNSKPTLTYNTLGRHVSRMVHTKVMSGLSPWLALDKDGAIHSIPVSHGEGRVVVSQEEGEALFKAGQVPFCYVDAEGNPTLAEPDNPNGSCFGIEGICSPDGRILGKMGHSERAGAFVHINIPGNKTQRIFEAGVNYFR